MSNKKTITIALGGNAILQAGQEGTTQEQEFNIRKAMIAIADIIEEGNFNVVLTHGNGPQAGALMIQQEDNTVVPPQDMDVVVSMTQGQIGYMIEQELQNLLEDRGIYTPVAAIVNQVRVNPDDPEFDEDNASKPVGPFYTKEEAEKMEKEKGYLVKKVKPEGEKSWRRVVPSPEPIENIEGEAIKRMIEAGIITVCSGGGGVPVIESEKGDLEGVPAVIDKDKAGEKLAEITKSDFYLILTDVDRVMLNFGSDDETEIGEMTVSEAKQYIQEGHFMEGSMKPKVEAALRFLENGGEKSVITSLANAREALLNGAGTTILKNQ